MASKLIRNSAQLLSANVFAQAIGLAVYPILTRLYAPEDFGLLNLFMNIGGFFILLANVDYHTAIVLPKEEKQSIALVHFTMLITLSVSLIVAISVPFAQPIAQLFHTPELTRWYGLLPLYILFTALWNILSYWYIRHAEYRRNNAYQVSQSSMGAIFKIVLGHLGMLQGGMILSVVIAPMLAIAGSITMAWRNYIRPLMHWDWQGMREVAVNYRKFPLYSFPSSMIGMLSSQLPILLLTPVFGTKDIGLWSMAILLGFAPLSMISKTFNQTLYQHTVDMLHRQEDIRPLYRRFTGYSLLIIIPIFTLLWFVLPDLTAWLLGAEWRTTGQILRWMLPWLGVNVLTASTGFLAGVYFRQNIELFFSILMIACRITAIGIGIYTHDLMLFNAIYFLSSFAVTTVQFIWLMTLTKRSSTISQ